MTDDPWASHLSVFEIRNAQVTGFEPDGKVLVRHDLHLTVTEGRFEHLAEDQHGKPAPSFLSYGCSIAISGAPASNCWSGTDMQIVVTGKHQNGAQITIAGAGAIGFDDAGSLGIEFDRAPEMVVQQDRES